MYFERFIALRYLKSRRKRGALSVITIISVIGIAIGVASLIITISIMNGFEKDVRQALIGANAHLTIDNLLSEISAKSYETEILPILDNDPAVQSFAPYILRQALLVSKARSSGAIIRAFDPDKVKDQEGLYNSLTLDSDKKTGMPAEILASLNKTFIHKDAETSSLGLPGIILGSTLSRNLRVGLGDIVQVVPPETRVTPFGSLPRFKRYVVTGLYQSGLAGYDEAIAMLDIKEAELIFKQDGYSAVAIFLNNPSTVDAEKTKLQNILPFNFNVRSWLDDNNSLFAVITLEKYGLAIILSLIIIVAGFNIISTILMLVQEKKRDIAVLKAIGATSGSILKIFFMQGMLLGLVGSLIGLVLGVAVCFIIANFDVLNIPRGVYVSNRIPMDLQYSQVAIILVLSLLISAIVTIFPARDAAKTNTVDGLRYE